MPVPAQAVAGISNGRLDWDDRDDLQTFRIDDQDVVADKKLTAMAEGQVNRKAA